MSDLRIDRSQVRNIFTTGGTRISWRSIKQAIVALSNHAGIITTYEAAVRDMKTKQFVLLNLRNDTVKYQDQAYTFKVITC